MLPVKFRQSSRPSRASPQGLCDLAAGPKAPGPLAAVWVEHKTPRGPLPSSTCMLGNTSQQPGPFIKARKWYILSLYHVHFDSYEGSMRIQGSGVRGQEEFGAPDAEQQFPGRKGAAGSWLPACRLQPPCQEQPHLAYFLLVKVIPEEQTATGSTQVTPRPLPFPAGQAMVHLAPQEWRTT